MKTVTLKVPNISCMHCVHTINTELEPLDGVSSVKATVDTKSVEVEVDDDDALGRVRSTLAEIGYPAEA